ncbi:pseudouridine synthase [Radiomyces spectabilis]|uniref:pseudouridine synthase n=1 Tax=Radiomyces spectabilis TaxID=64574 RepID=UPI00221EF7EF|nr:pseudouridine synthase [Radiomyces spectabilis]KAI8384851.1 pseudouridine synthase [Radiomyces spectabilis]
MGNLFSKSTPQVPEPTSGKRRFDPDEDGVTKRPRLADDDEALVTEDMVGIAMYVRPELPGFHCIIKYRAEDFLVNEVDLSGQVAHLTSFELPTIKTSTEGILTAPELDKRVQEVLGEDFSKQFRHFLDNPDNTENTISIQTTQESRYKFYRIIENHLDTKLALVSRDGLLKVSWPTSDTETRPPFIDYNELGGEYLQFNVYKAGVDTMGVVNLISGYSKIPIKNFGYAGNKDSRAITVQAMTLRRGRPEKLASIREDLEKRDIYIGNYSFVPQGLTLGDLSGNRFTIVLRDVTGSSEATISESLESLRKTGFINYFGMQRFGSSAIMTHEIGREVMKKNFEAATDLILKPRAGEKLEFAKARQVWYETRDATAALALFPKRARAERTIIGTYIQSPGDHKRAIGALPRNLRTLYCHAYQSYIWNRVVSERIKRFGYDKPLAGDLVLVDASDDDTVKTRKQTAKQQNAGRRDPNARKMPKILKESELEDYTIDDVVYPLPGSKTKYPKNEMGQFYKELLAQDDMQTGHFQNLPGDYRYMMAKAKDLTWSFVRYDDPMAKLCNTDIDILKSEAQPSAATGKHLALRLEFTLGTSQYATMLLREIMKGDTSSQSQSRLLHA